ncbi:MAG: 3-oxoacyl-ACP reductase family protein [Sandaracinaceae bacterium]|nr:3-oxoacyl-ACP reductase family protein [Sandaracinaceae bacterium]
MFDLSGKTAFVTGASRGIGRAIAMALAERGAEVGIGYARRKEAAEAVQREIRARGGCAEIVEVDVSVQASIEQAIEGWVRAKGKLDIFVSNAGIAIDQVLLRLRPEDLHRTWAVNVEGAIWGAKAAIRSMLRQRYGRVIFITSVVGETGNAGQAAYASSKAALIGLTKTLAREYASRGITVNAVAPGFIETEMTASLPDELRKRMIEQTPLGRIGKPEEVAPAVVYLASDEAAFVTGQVLRVNGGLLM